MELPWQTMLGVSFGAMIGFTTLLSTGIAHDKGSISHGLATKKQRRTAHVPWRFPNRVVMGNPLKQRTIITSSHPIAWVQKASYFAFQCPRIQVA